MVAACRAWAEAAGGFRAPRMPNGSVMSVQMTCLGWHWFPYRYSRTLDDCDGGAVAPFPGWLGELGAKAVHDARDIDPRVTATGPGDAIGPGAYVPDVALVNWYGPGARMGMHADRDERSPAPVVSVSVGDSCVFRFGNLGGRGRPWTDVHLESGDLFVFGGPSRLAYHGGPAGAPGPAGDRCPPRVGRPVRVRRTVTAGLPRRADRAAGHGGGRHRHGRRAHQRDDP